MTLTLNRQNFIKKFLDPLSKVAESCSLRVLSTKIDALVVSQDSNTILYAQYYGENKSVTGEVWLNLPNVRKLLQVLECIDDPFIDLKIESNHLAYKSPTIRFKYFLLDDGVIEKCPLKTEKIEAMSFQSGFKLTGPTLSEVVKGATFAAETNKLYISTNEQGVYGELTDHTIQNTNSVAFQLTEKFVGEQLSEIPVSMDVIRLLGSLKAPVALVKVNTTLKVILFEVSDSEYKLQFIVSPLVK